MYIRLCSHDFGAKLQHSCKSERAMFLCFFPIEIILNTNKRETKNTGAPTKMVKLVKVFVAPYTYHNIQFMNVQNGKTWSFVKLT